MLRYCLSIAATLPLLASFPARAAGLAVTPAHLTLTASGAKQQLVVSSPAGEAGITADRTATAQFTSLSPQVAQVSPAGVVAAVADGTARIRVRVGSQVSEAVVTVRGTRVSHAYSFPNDIAPLLSRDGCNAGTCHGKAEGQHGFKLSVFGYDLPADYQAITRGAGGRRVTRTDPGRSLLLLKATGTLPHGGGVRFRVGSEHYRLLAGWIAAEAPYGPDTQPTLTSVDVFPSDRALSPKSAQHLLVTAHYSDGSRRDVTREARYGSNSEPIASVDEDGVARSSGLPGEAAIMVNYRGAVAVSRLRIPHPLERGVIARRPPEQTFVDALVWNRLEKLRIRPAPPASDSEFLRRAYLDTIGVLPTPEEAREFLDECRPGAGGQGRGTGVPEPDGSTRKVERAGLENAQPSPTPHFSGGALAFHTAGTTAQKARAKLVDRLLARPEYADYWAMQWSDLLRVNKEKLGAKGAYSFYEWIHSAFASDMPYDRFIRELVTASGSSTENGAANFYRVLTKPEERAATVSQVFLGVRIECAQCHHHPFEKWSQNDYYGMVGFFTRVQSRPGSGGAGIVLAGGSGEAINPRTSQTIPPHALLGQTPDLSTVADRRETLAEWMTRPDNRFVPRMIANRLWAHFLGRGLVDPVDDFRDTNPPSNPELLDALAGCLVEHHYDLKAVMRAILNSQVYQLSAETNPSNRDDEQNFSRAYPKRLPAEVLLDAISQASGSPADFPGLPRGTRAVQMWDSEWCLQWQSYFLNAFGRPPRTSPCECERSQEPTIAQVLHLMNAPEIQSQLSGRRGRAHQLASSTRSDAEVIGELFLAAYSRRPNAKELAAARDAFKSEEREQAAEDLLWALINSPEFVFNH